MFIRRVLEPSSSQPIGVTASLIGAAAVRPGARISVRPIVRFAISIVASALAVVAFASSVGAEESTDIGRSRGNPQMVLTSDGTPVIAHFHPEGRIAMDICADRACHTKRRVNVEAPCGLGRSDHVALVVTSDDRPVLAYSFDNCTTPVLGSDLKVMVCDDPVCRTHTTRTVEASADGTLLAAITNDDRLVIAFEVDQGLRIVTCEDPRCEDSSTVTVPTAGHDGYRASLALNRANHPVIAYGTNAGINLIFCDDAVCTGTTTATPTAGRVEAFTSATSLTLTEADHPVLAYSNNGIQVVVCSDPACTSAASKTVDSIINNSHNDRTRPPALSLDGDGHPVIAYADYDNSRLRLAVCEDPRCDGVSNTTVSTPSQVHGASAVAVDNTGLTTIAHIGDPVIDPHFRRYVVGITACDDPRCSPDPSSSPAPTTDHYECPPSFSFNGVTPSPTCTQEVPAMTDGADYYECPRTHVTSGNGTETSCIFTMYASLIIDRACPLGESSGTGAAKTCAESYLLYRDHDGFGEYGETCPAGWVSLVDDTAPEGTTTCEQREQCDEPYVAIGGRPDGWTTCAYSERPPFDEDTGDYSSCWVGHSIEGTGADRRCTSTYETPPTQNLILLSPAFHPLTCRDGFMEVGAEIDTECVRVSAATGRSALYRNPCPPSYEQAGTGSTTTCRPLSLGWSCWAGYELVLDGPESVCVREVAIEIGAGCPGGYRPSDLAAQVCRRSTPAEQTIGGVDICAGCSPVASPPAGTAAEPTPTRQPAVVTAQAAPAVVSGPAIVVPEVAPAPAPVPTSAPAPTPAIRAANTFGFGSGAPAADASGRARPALALTGTNSERAAMVALALIAVGSAAMGMRRQTRSAIC